jgi:hypothetical protein
MSEAQAEAEARRIIAKDIRPPVEYLADQANIYSVKPVIFFDIAQMKHQQLGLKTWMGVGGGLQFNIVIACLEVGYMETFASDEDNGKGNFIVRFKLQNFY